MLTSRRIAGIGSREYPRLSDVARYVEVIPRDVPIITGGWWTHDGLAQPTRGVDRVVALTAAKDHVVILVMGPVGAGVVIRAWEAGGGRRYGKPSIKGPLGEEVLNAARGVPKPGSERTTSRGMHSRPPFFTLNPDGTGGMIRRQCTGDYKIDVIEAKLRELLGLRHRQWWPKKPVVEQWVGISRDEIERSKPSARAAIIRREPLIEMNMRRWDCERWLLAHDYPIPPKSACIFCPFRSDAQWLWLQENDPAGWEAACVLDEAIRDGLSHRGLDGKLFLHSSLVPLRLVDLRPKEVKVGQRNLFNNECEGMCGV